MLPKERRISKGLFDQIQKNGRNFRTPLFSLRIMTNPGQPSAFAFVISAKKADKAVTRNLIKRRGRAIIAKNLAKIKEGYLCAIFFNQDVSTLSFIELEKKILDGLNEAHLLQ